MSADDTTWPPFGLAIRIVQAQRALARGGGAGRTLLERGLAEDLERLGPPRLATEAHATRAAEVKEQADRLWDLRADPRPLYQEAAAHALWAGDGALAEACTKAYLRARTLLDLT